MTQQGELAFPPGRGGKRKGAGRKPGPGKRRCSHRTRAELNRREPLHVTLRIREGLPSLRRPAELAVLERALARGAEKEGFRLTEYSVQSNHLHLIVEADDKDRLARGVQGLAIGIAKTLNRLWRRLGSVFADRYHARALKTPREVKLALVYVLKNHLRHGHRSGHVDPCSSGRWFAGWADFDCADVDSQARPDPWSPLARARTWLLRLGWRKHWGPITSRDVPAIA